MANYYWWFVSYSIQFHTKRENVCQSCNPIIQNLVKPHESYKTHMSQLSNSSQQQNKNR